MTRQLHKFGRVLTALAVWSVVGGGASVWAGALGDLDSAHAYRSDGEPVGDLVGDQAGTTRVMLGNGLEVIVVSVKHDRLTDDEDVQAWLVVRAGSMYETDSQRGSALVLERLVRMGTEHFSSDQINELLIKGPVGYDGHDGSYVGFDQSAYLTKVELGDSDGLEWVFAFFGDVLDHSSLSFDPERVDEAKGYVANELRNEPIAELRAQRVWLPELMQGTPFGDRLVGADIGAIESLSVDELDGFAQKMYHPGQATVIVLGDVDANEIVGLVRDAIGENDPGGESRIVDGRCKIDVSMRAGFGFGAETGRHQAAMVWFRDRSMLASEATQAWSECASRYSDQDVRLQVIAQVAGEIVQHRIRRLATQAFGSEVEVRMDQVDLWGQIDLAQIVIEGQNDIWEDSMRFLVRECDRMSRDGVTQAEVGRARRAILARWHRGADGWGQVSNSRRIGLVHWMVTTGRPVIDLVRWDQMATHLMSGILDEELNDAVREMIKPTAAAYIAIVSEEYDGIELDDPSAMILDVVDQAAAARLDPIDDLWMEHIIGALIDNPVRAGEIVEVSQHAPSGAWEAVLENSVRVRARAMNTMSKAHGEQFERIYLAATIWGEVLYRVHDDQAIEGAMVAWREPATESRGRNAVSAYMAEHDLRVSASHAVGYLQLRVDGPTRSSAQAMELMYVLLNRPVIEREAFDQWREEQPKAEGDPVDEAIKRLYLKGYPFKVANGFNTLDDAQRLLTQIVRKGQIDIGIASRGDAAEIIEEAGELFGSLVRRDVPRLVDPGLETKGTGAIGRERSLRIESVSQSDQGIVIGYLGCDASDISTVRSLVLSSMVLNDRLKVIVDQQSFDGTIRARLGYSDVLDGRAIFFVRAWCAEDDFDQAYEIIDEAIAAIASQGIGRDEFKGAQSKIDEGIGQYFDAPSYWSQRLSILEVKGRSVEDLWRIRQGYGGLDSEYTQGVLDEVLSGDERFRVEVVEPR